MKWFGLTGGIACGKSTVTGMLREAGVHVIDADQIAREVVEPGQPALEAITEAFGTEIVDQDGRLDREALGARVFGDDEARATLNGIIHPAIAARSAELLTAAREAGEPMTVYDAALIVENGAYRMMDGLIVVSVTPEVQLERLMARDDLDEEAARARVDAQMPLDEKAAVANWIIDNSGSREETRRQVEALLERLHAVARGDAQPPSPRQENADV